MKAARAVRVPHIDASVLEYPPAHSFLRKLAVLPFEAAIALVSVWAGVVSLLGFTIGGQTLSAALPPWMVAVFNLLYVLSGLAILLGVGWGYRNLEASGLILLLMSLLVRCTALVVVVGLTGVVLVTQFSTVIFMAAALLRLVAVLKRAVIAQINGRIVTVE